MITGNVTSQPVINPEKFFFAAAANLARFNEKFRYGSEFPCLK